MMSPAKGPDSLDDWLVYLETLHPKAIEMGLERVNLVKTKLEQEPSFPVITVGGTNGKGSVCTMLESILFCAGYRVGCYTSPHLIRYNERVRINKKEIDDEELCFAFDVIDIARQSCDTSLTFFEFGTLAAMHLFIDNRVDVAIMEVGLGGRLDAVNIFDTDCAILTSIDLDHVEYLGNTREKIGLEKAAIFRKNKPAICSEINLPNSVIEQVKKIDVPFFHFNEKFGYLRNDRDWNFWGPRGQKNFLPFPALRGEKQLLNASTSLAALDTLADLLPVTMRNICQGLTEAVVPGRFQVIMVQPLVVLDVAHNPAAAAVLADNLAATKTSGQTYAVFSMLQDKDISGVIQNLKDEIDFWLVSSVQSLRAATTEYLVNMIHDAGVLSAENVIHQFPDCVEAFVFACNRVTKNDRICVFGSFYTVSDVLKYLNSSQIQ